MKSITRWYCNCLCRNQMTQGGVILGDALIYCVRFGSVVDFIPMHPIQGHCIDCFQLEFGFQ